MMAALLPKTGSQYPYCMVVRYAIAADFATSGAANAICPRPSGGVGDGGGNEHLQSRKV